MNQGTIHRFHAPAALGLSRLVAGEVKALGAKDIRVTRSSVSFLGTQEIGYRACLWSRCASRILLELARFPAKDATSLYLGAAQVPWHEHMDPSQTFAIRATGANRELHHTGFVAQRVKDAVVDSFRKRSGRRPSVDNKAPDVQFQVHLEGTQALVSLDLAGAPLHQRGYRVQGAQAPLKETVAAGILLFADWPGIARSGGAFVDPMCGGGTLPIEAAWIAGDIAPGILRKRFGFHGWLHHDEALWQRIIEEAANRATQGRAAIPPVVGFEADRTAVAAAIEAARRAGLEGVVHFERRELHLAEPLDRSKGGSDRRGLVAVNPPYGHRLGEVAQLRILYASLGRILTERFAGFRVAVLTSEEDLAASLGLGQAKEKELRNGAIACKVYRYDRDRSEADHGTNPRKQTDATRKPSGTTKKPIDATGKQRNTTGKQIGTSPQDKAQRGLRNNETHNDPQAQAFANRLKKRARHMARWARRNGITCYRVYDADIPEYAVAIDRYEDFVHVQEYAPPSTVDRAAAAKRLADVLTLIPEVLEVPREQMFVKVRRRHKGASQYRKIGSGGNFRQVREGGHRFLVNFENYLDTGLFLDHRLVRQRIFELARNKRFLNLFCYTASASVYAAKGGSRDTTSVDRSPTYLGWARRNLVLNGLSERRNRVVQADARRFLSETDETWDLIFVDPPTFSNTKSGDPPFDVQRDHVALLTATAQRLAAGGLILFSTNKRRFRLDEDALSDFHIQNISPACLPEDFKRSPKIHRVYELRPKTS